MFYLANENCWRKETPYRICWTASNWLRREKRSIAAECCYDVVGWFRDATKRCYSVSLGIDSGSLKVKKRKTENEHVFHCCLSCFHSNKKKKAARLFTFVLSMREHCRTRGIDSIRPENEFVDRPMLVWSSLTELNEMITTGICCFLVLLVDQSSIDSTSIIARQEKLSSAKREEKNKGESVLVWFLVSFRPRTKCRSLSIWQIFYKETFSFSIDLWNVFDWRIDLKFLLFVLSDLHWSIERRTILSGLVVKAFQSFSDFSSRNETTNSFSKRIIFSPR